MYRFGRVSITIADRDGDPAEVLEALKIQELS